MPWGAHRSRCTSSGSPAREVMPSRVDVARVVLHGLRTEGRPQCGLPRGEPLGHQRDDLPLARAEPDAICAELLAILDRPVTSAPVETDGARRAAMLLADLV